MFELGLVIMNWLWYNKGYEILIQENAYERQNCDSGCQREQSEEY